jgi:2-methylcitrate dehydratase PrpD
VQLVDGRIEEAVVTTPRGSEARPMSDAELEAKFRDNAAIGGFADRAEAQIAAIWALEEAPDLSRLMGLLA